MVKFHQTIGYFENYSMASGHKARHGLTEVACLSNTCLKMYHVQTNSNRREFLFSEIKYQTSFKTNQLFPKHFMSFRRGHTSEYLLVSVVQLLQEEIMAFIKSVFYLTPQQYLTLLAALFCNSICHCLLTCWLPTLAL